MYNQKINEVKQQEAMIEKQYQQTEHVLAHNIVTQPVVTETHTVPVTQHFDVKMQTHVDNEGRATTNVQKSGSII